MVLVNVEGLISTKTKRPTGLPSDYKASERILAPIPGIVTRVFIKPGDQVKAGDALFVIEAMKMKNTIRSGYNLEVAAVYVSEGQIIKAKQLLVEFAVEKEKNSIIRPE